MFQANNSVFFWSADILFLYLFSKIFLNTYSIHRHHILSLFIFFLFDIYLSIIIIFGPNFNYMQIIFILLYNCLYAFKVVYGKKLMEFNFISYYKLCFIIGIITFFYNAITLIVETIIKENKYISSKYEIYFDSFLEYWNKINDKNYSIIKEILFIISYMITMGISNIFLYITLFYLTPFHVLIINIFLCIGFNLITRIGEQSISFIFIINVCIYGLSIFVLFVFLEIIELEFCGLNINTKEEIQKRSLNKTTSYSDKSLNDSSSLNDEGEKTINLNSITMED